MAGMYVYIRGNVDSSTIELTSTGKVRFNGGREHGSYNGHPGGSLQITFHSQAVEAKCHCHVFHPIPYTHSYRMIDSRSADWSVVMIKVVDDSPQVIIGATTGVKRPRT